MVSLHKKNAYPRNNGPYVLCQDCLRILCFSHDLHVGKQKCVCGGDFCGCPSCNSTVQLLFKGFLTSEALHIRHDLASWTPENGGVDLVQGPVGGVSCQL